MEWIVIALIVTIVAASLVASAAIMRRGVSVDIKGLMLHLTDAAKSKSTEIPSWKQLAYIKDRTKLLRQELPRLRILWVDSKPLENINERSALASLGIFCDCYTDVAHCLTALQQADYDAIISDERLAEDAEDSFTIILWVRENKPFTPVIFYGQSMDEEFKRIATRAGASLITSDPSEFIVGLLRLCAFAYPW
ncbi:MAG: hypothetical protein Q7R34_08125 [Dehalococcoidia bacterium]|nr:hypothetical protein [Dehalococcoidia bacterium]